MGKDVSYRYYGYDFVWDEDKARANIKKHGVSFEEACQAVVNPMQVVEEASAKDEQRWGIISFTLSEGRASPLYVVVVGERDKSWRVVSARVATRTERLRYEEEIDSE